MDILELLSLYTHRPNETYICILAPNLIHLNECWSHCLHLPLKLLQNIVNQKYSDMKSERLSAMCPCVSSKWKSKMISVNLQITKLMKSGQLISISL